MVKNSVVVLKHQPKLHWPGYRVWFWQQSTKSHKWKRPKCITKSLFLFPMIASNLISKCLHSLQKFLSFVSFNLLIFTISDAQVFQHLLGYLSTYWAFNTTISFHYHHMIHALLLNFCIFFWFLSSQWLKHQYFKHTL